MEAQANTEKDKPSAPPADAGSAPKTPAEKAAGAKPAAKKEEVPAQPLQDNGDGTITDPNTGLMWKKADAWLDTKKFHKWSDHKAYVDDINKKKFAGHADWRIPTKAEAASLVSKDKQSLDKNGITIPLDPIFDAGSASNTWISECTADKIIRFDLKVGVDTPYPGKDVFSSIRLVRKPK
jgi:hypothetical protein